MTAPWSFRPLLDLSPLQGQVPVSLHTILYNALTLSTNDGLLEKKNINKKPNYLSSTLSFPLPLPLIHHLSTPKTVYIQLPLLSLRHKKSRAQLILQCYLSCFLNLCFPVTLFRELERTLKLSNISGNYTTFSSSHSLLLSLTSGKTHHPSNLTKAFDFQLSPPLNSTTQPSCFSWSLSTKLFLLVISGASDKTDYSSLLLLHLGLFSPQCLSVFISGFLSLPGTKMLVRILTLAFFPFHSPFSRA